MLFLRDCLHAPSLGPDPFITPLQQENRKPFPIQTPLVPLPGGAMPHLLLRSFASAACQGDAPHAPPRQIALSDQRPPGPKELLPPLAAPIQATTAPPAARAAASGSCPGGQRRRHGRSRVQRCGRSQFLLEKSFNLQSHNRPSTCEESLLNLHNHYC